jgi:hypothetical protein
LTKDTRHSLQITRYLFTTCLVSDIVLWSLFLSVTYFLGLNYYY